MTHAEQEEMLRRALHAVADAIEPAPDGLERIRERLSKPRPLAVAWLMAGWTGLAQPLLLRIEPVLAEPTGRLSDRLAQWLRLMIGGLRAAGARLRLVIRSPGAAGARLRPAGQLRLVVERLRPVRELLAGAIRMLRPGSGMSRHEKLRSALAVGAAALIGAAGGFALAGGLPPVITAAGSVFSVFSPNAPPGASAGNSSPGEHGTATQLTPGSSGPPGSVHSGILNPGPVCPSGPNPGLAPSPSPQGPIPPSTIPPSTTPPSTTPPSTTPPSTTPPSPSPTPPSPTSPGSTPAQVNASAGVGTGPTSSATPQSSSTVSNGTIGTRPVATPTPSAGASPKPYPSASGCGGG